MTDSKRLPRIPTPAMVGAAIPPGSRHHRDAAAAAAASIVRMYQAMYDAAPDAPPVRLTRTDAPTEPGWYWAGDHGQKPEPVYVVPHLGGFVGCFQGDEFPLTAWANWYGPLELPEVSP